MPSWTTSRHRSRWGANGNPVVGLSTLATPTPGSAPGVKLAGCVDPTCSSATLRTLDPDGAGSSVTIGTDGNPVVAYAYAGSTAGEQRIAACGDPTCASATISVVDSVGALKPSVVIGRHGNPVVAYGRPLDTTLFVATCGNPTCSPYTPPNR